MSGREKLGDDLFIILQILSHLLLILGGLFGYLSYQFYGSLIFALLGYVTGVWIRRSLGIRGRKSTTGFFARMRERAFGSRPGLLEGLIENISGKGLSQAECKHIMLLYDKSVAQLKQSKSSEVQNRVLDDLDRKVRQIVYGSRS